MERDDEALGEWLKKIRSTNDPLRALHAFQLGVHAAAMREAAGMVADTDVEEPGEIAGILEAQAQNCDEMCRRACGE